MTETPSPDVKRAVEYLKESDEPLDSKVSVVKNATDTGEFTTDDILSEYADSVSVSGVIYPMHESQLQELHSGIQQQLGEGVVSPLPEICHPHSLIETKDDVVTQAINLYTNDDIPSEERQEQIKTLIKDARRDGIDVNPDEVIQSLKEFSSTASATTDSTVEGVGVGMESVSLATGVETPDEIQAEEEYVYQVSVADNATVKEIDWYIGGTHAGSGKTVLHTFEFPGVYTISVELSDTDGRTDHINTEVEVIDPSTIDLAIEGDQTVDAGETVQYRADITTNNETVQELEWELDNVPAGEGKVLSTTFDHDGDHTLSLTAHGKSGLTVTETQSITAETPTDITVTVDAPERVFAGETENIHCTIDVENSYIDKTTCKVGDEVIPVDEASTISFEHTFEDPGEYPITVTASNNSGDTDTGVATVECFVEPEVKITDPPEEVIRGDGETFEAEFDERLNSSWGVNNASLTHVGDRTAQVTFNSGIADEASVTIEVENQAGDTTKDTVPITVHEPTVTAAITHPETITAGNAVELSAADTEVEYAEIERIEWKLGDGMMIGRGETITYEFGSPGEYTISATVHTDRGIGDTANARIEVEPETDVTAVTVTRGGPTTRDEFVLDASKSVAQNTRISTYTWELESGEELTGETTDVTFETPGDYEVELTVETKAGDVDSDTSIITVEQYTEVTAGIDGPDEIVVGDRARFSARGSEPVNTTITDYEWSLNDKPAGSGEVFTQTFSKPGHYTVQVEVTSATGDSDTASTGIVVETPESKVDAGLSIETTETPTVGDSVTLSAEPTKIEHGELKTCEWVINEDPLANSADSVNVKFEEYGEATVELTAIASDGVTDTVEEVVYVSPAVSTPPYTELPQDAAKADVFAAAVEIYQDSELTTADRNRFVAHLLWDAEDGDIEVTADEVTDHLADIEAVEQETIEIDQEAVEDEREYRYVEETEEDESDDSIEGETWEIDTETGSEEEQETADDIGDPSEVDFGGDEGEKETGEEDTGSVEDEDDEELWDTGGGDETEVTDTTEEDTDITDPEDATLGDTNNEESDGETDDEEEGDEDSDSGDDEDEEVDDDEIPEVDEDEIDDRHKEGRISPESYDIGESVLAMPNYTQDLMDFEYILDEGDELVPEGVNGAGVIVCENDLYVAIARVQGRDWSIHTAQKQRDIVKSFESQFLTGLDSPIQITSIPTRFDLREHIHLVNGVLEENQDNEEELLMNIGRTMYPNWLESFMSQNDMKERQFYIVVPLSAEQLHKFKGGSESLTENLAEVPIIGDFFSRFTKESVDDITKYQCLRELNTRMNRIKSNLRRLDVQVERVDDRNEAMAVLYHYFHDVEPEREVFPTGPFTTHDEGEATIGGVSVDHLLEETEPAHEGVDETGGEA